MKVAAVVDKVVAAKAVINKVLKAVRITKVATNKVVGSRTKAVVSQTRAVVSQTKVADNRIRVAAVISSLHNRGRSNLLNNHRRKRRRWQSQTLILMMIFHSQGYQRPLFVKFKA
jgi:hypothetical protein